MMKKRKQKVETVTKIREADLEINRVDTSERIYVDRIEKISARQRPIVRRRRRPPTKEDVLLRIAKRNAASRL
jgi:hypothetical protein